MSENGSKKQKTNPDRVDAPVVRDLKRLVEGVKKDVQKAVNCCSKTAPNIHVGSYEMMAEAVLMRIVLLNMRRMGNMSKMTIQDWQNSKESKNVLESIGIIDSLSDLEKKLAKDFLLIKIDGKPTCLVPPDAKEGIELLVQYRSKVGVFPENPMVFAIPKRMAHIQANDVLRTFTKKHCVKPEQIRSPKQREYLATASQILDLGDKAKEYLANHLGDTVKAHTDSYQKYNDSVEVAKISQILMLAESGQLSSPEKSSEIVQKGQSDLNGNELSQNNTVKHWSEMPEKSQSDLNGNEVSQNDTVKYSSEIAEKSQSDLNGNEVPKRDFVPDETEEISEESLEAIPDETKEESKENSEKPKTGYMAPMKVSSDLAAIIGKNEASRSECVKLLWAYLKKNNLQDPQNKQYFTPDDKMAKVFGTERVKGFGMAKFLNGHLESLTEAKPSRKRKQKPKEIPEASQEKTKESPEKPKTGYMKPMKVSSDLADIIGRNEASRSDCVKLLWEYLKKNNLQDPANKQYFTPDDKMAKIFGTERVKGFGMAKYLNDHLEKL